MEAQVEDPSFTRKANKDGGVEGSTSIGHEEEDSGVDKEA
jgi:hypothetical protein